MKKTVLMLCIVFAILSLLLIPSFADGEITPTVSTRGYLHGGEQFTLIYSLSEIECCGFKGNIVYDSSIVKLVSSKSLKEGWTFELLSEDAFLSFSNDISNRENDFKGGDLFEITFEVNESFKQDDICTISLCNVEASDLENDIIIPDIEYKKEGDPPRSDDSTLKRLLVGGASLTPAFSPEVREYNIGLGVDYETQELELTVEPTNERASFEIIGNKLEVGNNTVIIRVTADNGVQSDYTISVKRNHSSDQPQSNDSRLSWINLSEGILSPDFSPDVYRYIVYLPYEAKNIDISAEPMNAFARSVSVESGAIEVGYNEFTIRCVAEDTTSSEYVIIVYVMDKFDGTGPSTEGKRQLSGVLKIQQEQNESGDIVVSAKFNSELPDATYDICWYSDGKMVTVSDTYTIASDDKDHSLIAVARGKGDYSGYVVGDLPILFGDISNIPQNTLTPGNDDAKDKAHLRNVILFVCVILSALFLFFGLLIGESKGKNKIKNKMLESMDTESESDNSEITPSDDPEEEENEENKENEENEVEAVRENGKEMPTDTTDTTDTEENNGDSQPDSKSDESDDQGPGSDGTAE